MLIEERGHGGWQYGDAQVGWIGSGPWYGKARYTQAGAVDSPFLLWLNNGEPRVLHRNWRGNVAGATLVDGDSLDTGTVWPAAYGDIWLAPDALQTPPAPNKWLGSLVTSSKDVTGTLYRRNRYYDPVSGRFTQEDPIGLAGSMNLYGYAAGDPVNNSDPFGLCLPINTCDLLMRALMSRSGVRFVQRVGAVGDFVRNYRDMREANTQLSDKYFHAKANCEATQRGPAGESTAERLSNLREKLDSSWPKNDTAEEVEQDQVANRAGRAAGRSSPSGSCAEMVKQFRPNGLDQRYE